MKRVCPSCNKSIKDNNLYFCLSCGNKLDEDLVSKRHPFKTKTSKFEPSEDSFSEKLPSLKNIHLSKKLIVAFSFVVLAGVVSVGAILFTMSKVREQDLRQQTTQPVQEAAQPVEKPNSIDLELGQENINLNDEDHTKYVPYGNYFYTLGANILNTYKQVFGDFTEQSILFGLDTYIEGKYILIGEQQEDSWLSTLVLYLKDDESADQDFEELNRDGWYAKKVGDVLVITQKEEMIALIEESAKGASKNISHHPKYRRETTQVPEEGQILYVNLTSSNPMEKLVDIYSPPHEFIRALKNVIAQNPTKFVIRNNND